MPFAPPLRPGLLAISRPARVRSTVKAFLREQHALYCAALSGKHELEAVGLV